MALTISGLSRGHGVNVTRGPGRWSDPIRIALSDCPWLKSQSNIILPIFLHCLCCGSPRKNELSGCHGILRHKGVHLFQVQCNRYCLYVSGLIDPSNGRLLTVSESSVKIQSTMKRDIYCWRSGVQAFRGHGTGHNPTPHISLVGARPREAGLSSSSSTMCTHNTCSRAH